MSRVRDIEKVVVDALMAANLPELEGFLIESLAGQVDLENDELNLGVKSLLVAFVGATHTVSKGDPLDLAFVAVVPGTNQGERRLEALEAAMAIRDWMDDANTNLQPKTTRTERLHPVAIVALFAQLIG